jgi:hypothetical protein
MRWWWRSIVVLGALALIALVAPLAAGTVSAGSERIPRAARDLEALVARPHRPPTSHVSVTSPAMVRRFASLINGLETVPAGALDCTGKADDPVVTFTFRAAPEGRVLARARQIVELGAPRGSCEPMTLTVKGHPRTPLLGGTGVVRAAQRLLGVRLPRG